MFETLRAIGRAILPSGKKEEVSLQSASVHTPPPPKKADGVLSGSVHLPPPNEHLIRFANDDVEVPQLTDAQYEQLKKKIDALYTGPASADQQKVTEGAPEDVRLKIKLTKKGDKLVLDLNDLMDETGAKSVNIRFGGNNITLGGNGNSSVVIGSGNVFSSSISTGGNVVVDGDYMKVGDNIEMDGDYMRVGNITMGRKKRNR